ncbi:MAG: YcnI family protein [Jatrophihabitantaceae bacterium]
MNRLRTLAVVAATAGAAMLALAGPASAHVTVSAPGATRGGSDQEITFRVPVEKNVDTVGLAVALPTDTPIASVLVDPIYGWTQTVKTTKLATPIKTDDGDITEAVSEIDWKAQPGHGLKPGEFGAFTIIAGQLPDVSSLQFGAIQTYSDGSVVSWTQVAAPGSTAEPDFPKPTLSLAAAGATGDPTVAAPAAKSSSDTGPIVLSVIALLVAAAALGIAFVSRAKGARD